MPLQQSMCTSCTVNFELNYIKRPPLCSSVKGCVTCTVCMHRETKCRCRIVYKGFAAIAPMMMLWLSNSAKLLKWADVGS